MPRLVVQVLGGVSVSLDGCALGAFPTRWSAGLLASLALDRGRLLHRDVLAARFWPEETDQRARKALRNALWAVRHLVEPDGVRRGAFVTIDGPLIGMAPDADVWVDASEFERLLSWSDAAGHPEVGLSPLHAAVGLYRGDLLEGYDFGWCVPDRERLRLAHLTALERLMELHMDRRDWSQAIPLGQEILRRDPLREQIHRRLMVCHLSQGNRPLAIRQYRSCLSILDEELGIAPMAATQQLYREMQSDAFENGTSDGALVATGEVGFGESRLAALREARIVRQRLLSQLTPT
jgi:DNA-binding SARP family transcriptional activator